MSKIVTISLAMDLVEEGVISLNDDVADYIPEFKNLKLLKVQMVKLNHWDDISLCPLTEVQEDYIMTVSDLINHKAGFIILQQKQIV